MKTDNEKIEAFYVSLGGKPSLKEDLWFYESDWNMLMPVVEKIKQLRDFDTVTDGKHNRDPYFATRVADLLGILTTVDIKVVHLAVVAFIDWYNNNTS